MGRLSGFDYTSPYFYMVTLHAKPGIEAFSKLSDQNESGLTTTPATRPMKKIIFSIKKTFHHSVGLVIQCLMPNHLHIIVKIHNGKKRPSLFAIVKWLDASLSSAYYDALKLPRGESIFEEKWHDWIVLKKGMLQAFIDYVKNNPSRALYRRKHRNACVPRVYFTAHFMWTCLGTCSLRETPVRVPVICSRSILPESMLWEEWRSLAQRLGPGSLAVGTFMSPCEKMVREEVLKNGGCIVQLIPHGIGPKGHASAEDEPLLAAGRLSILSPFPYDERKLTKQELHNRCHQILHPLAQRFRQGVEALPASRLPLANPEDE